MRSIDRSFAEQELALLTEWGPRLTGTSVHERLVDHVAGRLAELGLRVHEDVHTFTRWDAPDRGEGLRLTVGNHETEISSAFPYSGVTGPDGITGALRLLSGPVPRWSKARGGIAVVEVRNRPVPLGELVRTWDDEPGWHSAPNPLVPATLAGAGLGRARRAGVRGVVFAWRDITPAHARDQYLPFTLPYQDIPAVFVAGEAADTVLAAARSNDQARLTLDATLTPGTRTRTVWAVAEGEQQPDEAILVVSHSDGTNAVEENGHIGLLSLARDVVADRPRRTVIFVLATGHLRIPEVTSKGQAATRWLSDHPDQWSRQQRAVAGLVIEHLGARQYGDEPASGRFGPTGAAEPELLYATTRELKTLVDLEWQGGDRGPTRVSAPGPLIQFGEGEPLHDHGIPAVALVTAPQYLLSTHQDDYVDLDLLIRQVDSFHRLLRRLDDLPAGHFGTVTHAGPLAKAVSAGKVLARLCKG
ncbi:hypothetical protein [Streptomyces sp. NPDC127092]|uniref:hypothetical protein n=1 Tax=Streptomyces sp. NPDC127092 TaxID=3347135 RepID=UPI00365F9C98